MKKFIFISLFSFLTAGSIHAQPIAENSVGRQIRDSLKTRFPGASGISWTKVNNGYEAKFSSQSKSMKVAYDDAGQWQRIEGFVRMDSLRPAVRRTLQSQFAGSTQKSATRVLSLNGAPHNEIILERDGKESRVSIDDSGRVIKTE